MLVTGIETRWISFNARPMAIGAKPFGAFSDVAESLVVSERRAPYVHPETGAETQIFTVRRREHNRPFTLAEALGRADDETAGGTRNLSAVARTWSDPDGRGNAVLLHTAHN